MPELRYHHIGIPTVRPLPAEDYSKKYKLYASGYLQSPYGVEWMKFDPDCPVPELVKTVPHVAFVVDDIQMAIAGKQILIEPNSPTEGGTSKPGYAVASGVSMRVPSRFVAAWPFHVILPEPERDSVSAVFCG
jgi:hypothetical protein